MQVNNPGNTGPIPEGDVQDAISTGKVGDASSATRPNAQPASELTDGATVKEAVAIPTDKVAKSEQQPALRNENREATLAEAGLERASGVVTPKDVAVKTDPQSAANDRNPGADRRRQSVRREHRYRDDLGADQR